MAGSEHREVEGPAEDAPRHRHVGGVVPVAVAAVGLTALVGTQLSVTRSHVEHDLSTRSREALRRAGLTGIDVAVVGQDVTLIGSAASAGDVERAARLVRAQEGVRVASVRVAVAAPPAPPIAHPTPTPPAPVPPAVVTIPATAIPGTSGTPAASGTPAPSPTPTAVTTPAPVHRPGTPAASAAQLRAQLAALPRIGFEVGRSTPNARSRATIHAIARILAAHPGLRVRLDGFTDDVGSRRVNLQLSAARAAVVRLDLILDGVDKARLLAVGRGESRPAVPNTSVANRAINRRVTLTVLE